jgi:hypothetical protein
MRKTVLLTVVCLLLLWVGQASAYYRGLAKPKFGDPDEFQTCKYRDQVDVRSGPPDGNRQDPGVTPERYEQPKPDARRYLSIGFAGRTFFLER